MTPPLLLAMARYAFLADQDLLDDLNEEITRTYAVAGTLLADPLRADDDETLVAVAGAELWARDEDPSVDTAAAERGAFIFGLAMAYRLLRGDGR